MGITYYWRAVLPPVQLALQSVQVPAWVGGLRDKGIIPAGADFNNLEPGIYTVNKDNLQNQPVNLLGTLIYFGTNYGMQIYTPILEYALYYRTKDVGSSSWKNWTKLTGVSISLRICLNLFIISCKSVG